MPKIEAQVAENIENKDIENPGEAQAVETTAQAESVPQPAKESWENDKRWGKMWKSHEDSYKSYKEMEKMLSPLKEKVGTYEKTFKEYQLDFAKFPEYVKEYRELKDPNNLTNQRAQYMDTWLSHPEHSQKVINFFSELEQAELQKQFPGMNQEQIERFKSLENEFNRMKTEREQIESEKVVSSLTDTIDQGYSKIEKLCKDYGVPLSENFRNEFLTYCEQNGVDPKHVYHAFRVEYEDIINSAYAKKVEADFMNRVEKNKKAGIVPKASGPAPSAPQKMSTKDRLAKAMFGKTYDALN
jgi:hypothetical protein